MKLKPGGLKPYANQNGDAFSPLPVPCACGSRNCFVDARQDDLRRRRELFVWCADCEHEGPISYCYDEAVRAWNGERRPGIVVFPSERTKH
jgi:hypothetical protein